MQNKPEAAATRGAGGLLAFGAVPAVLGGVDIAFVNGLRIWMRDTLGFIPRGRGSDGWESLPALVLLCAAAAVSFWGWSRS